MRTFDQIYVDGCFVTPHGTELFDLNNPANGERIGRVRLGDVEDARAAIAAARRAFPAFALTTKTERLAILQRLAAAMKARVSDLTEAMVEEYGAPIAQAGFHAGIAADTFLAAAQTLEGYQFEQSINKAHVVMEPIGVVAIITPWNSNAYFICGKLAMAIAAGCTVVIKPSEMSAAQTQIVMDALHEAGLAPGVFNIVTGRGEVVGAEFSSHPDVAKVSFTGSTAVGKAILRAGAETMKRVTLELGGKSPTIVLNDADLATAVSTILMAGFANNGQACIAGTRVLVPASRAAEFSAALKAAVGATKVGDPREPDTMIGPLVSRKQWERVQRYIRLGVEEGATVLVGGEGKPAKLEAGYFVKPTVFTNVRNDMTIAREEIFGPVLSVITYCDEEEAVAIANDTVYGLTSYVISADAGRARKVGARISAGGVTINGFGYEPQAPFGGFKQSGLGRERGVRGLEAHLEAKVLLDMTA